MRRARKARFTWYIAQVDGETAEVMGRAFTAQYPGVKVAVIRTTGQVAYERLMQDMKNNAPQCDVFSTTDIAHMPALMQTQGAGELHAGQCRRTGAGVSRVWDRTATGIRTTPP